MLPVVALFTTNPRLRETLAVLLEHDCYLDLVPSTAGLARRPAPALVLVATDAPAAVAAKVGEVWPEVSLVVIGNTEGVLPAVPAQALRAKPPVVVALDPCAIRSVVLKHVRSSGDDVLRACAAAIGAALQGDWTPRLCRLRACLAEGWPSVAAREDAAALLAESEALQLFRDRPRQSRELAGFIDELSVALRRQLEPVECESSCAEDPRARSTHGPFDLADFIAALLAVRIRNRRARMAVKVMGSDGGLRVVFDGSGTDAATHVALPLVLAGLALDTWAWRVLVRCGGPTEEVKLCRLGVAAGGSA